MRRGDLLAELLLRKLRVGLDLANLQHVPLLVGGNQQRPLVAVASLACYDVAAQVVIGCPDVRSSRS